MNPKELSLCHKLWFFNPNIFATQSQTQEIFQTMISVRSNSLSLKYQRFTPSGLKDMELEILSMRQWLNSFVYLIVSLIFGLSRVDIDETFWNIREYFKSLFSTFYIFFTFGGAGVLSLPPASSGYIPRLHW